MTPDFVMGRGRQLVQESAHDAPGVVPVAEAADRLAGGCGDVTVHGQDSGSLAGGEPEREDGLDHKVNANHLSVWGG
ncbi:hypothetical protein ACIBMZ_20725 [Micromonospora sp. NPDC049900]|uniref:hypothetical protein n=1 Tax=Micromonospora sp. NPDC049900 TaxID=3364275 RepID=UPI0037A9FCCD